MNKVIKVINEEKKILQVTTVNERWYIKEDTDVVTGLPMFKYVPSVTWICDYYPKGIGFYKWLADKGWDESQALKEAAAGRGSKVHLAIGDLINYNEVKIDAKYANPETGEDESLTLEEYECLLSFVEWVKDYKPTFIKSEFIVWNNADGYAGTVDLLCTIGEDTYIVDFKTGQNIFPPYELQLSAYAKALPEPIPNVKLAILQLGYLKDKKKYKFTDIDDKYNLFLATREIWKSENDGVSPRQRDYPLSIQLTKEV